MIDSKEIAFFLNAELIGNNSTIFYPSDINEVKNNAVYFYWGNDDEVLKKIIGHDSVVVLKRKPSFKINYICIDNPRLAYSKVVSRFFIKNKKSYISSTASIDKTVVLGKNVTVCAGAVIEPNVKIGSNTYIDSYVVIKENVQVGESCYIGPQSVIGNSGFGYDFDDTIPVFIPHIGSVVIGDHVSVGANVTIKRGVLINTMIGDHTKINDLVRIAHNVVIGKKCIIAGGSISGSSVIGDGSWLAPGSIIQNKIKVGKNCLVGTGSVVVKDITDNKVVFGNPAKVIRNRNEV